MIDFLYHEQKKHQVLIWRSSKIGRKMVLKRLKKIGCIYNDQQNIKFFFEDHQEWEDKCCKSGWKRLTVFTMNKKSGMYIKLFCEDRPKWEDKCCKSDWKWLTVFTMNNKSGMYIKLLWRSPKKTSSDWAIFNY